MSLLSKLHNETHVPIDWIIEEGQSYCAIFDHNDTPIVISCTECSTTKQWIIDLTLVPLTEATTLPIQNIIDRIFQMVNHTDTNIKLVNYGDYASIMESICKNISLWYEVDYYKSDRCYTIVPTQPGDLLVEEHNTSLMYHKLFPNYSLLRELEAFGYSFEMGAGLKLQKKFFASQHRNVSGPRRQRSIQSLLILKNGLFFRQIPKPQWVMLVDPTDNNSKTWGEMFMRKLLDTEKTKYQNKLQAANQSS